MPPIIGNEPWLARRSRSVHLGVLVAAIGVAISVIWVSAAINADRSKASDVLEDAGSLAYRRVTELNSAVVDRLNAVTGLFRSSDEVTAAEFERFIEDIGLVPGMDGIGYVRQIAGEELTELIEFGESQHGRFTAFGLTEALFPQPLGEKDQYAIVLYVAPQDVLFASMIGLDIDSLEIPADTLLAARQTGATRASSLFEMPGQADADAFFVTDPIAPTDDEVEGYAIALLDLSDMLDSGMRGHIVPDAVWQVTDVTDGAGAPAAAWTRELDVSGRVWSLGVDVDGPAGGWNLLRILTLTGGIVLSALFGAITVSILESRRGRDRLQALEQQARQRERVLGIVSHELRTPLTAVVGFLDEVRARGDDLSTEDRNEMLRAASEGAEEMAALVADLLVHQRILSGVDLPVVRTPVDVVDIVEGEIAKLPPERSVALDARVRGMVLVDPVRLRQIIRNLVDNAFRHGRPPVTVLVGCDDDVCTIRVRDAGPGVDRCCVPTLFDNTASGRRHTHLDKSESHGLGLPVSAYLARRMDGVLSYDEDLGDFVVSFPCYYSLQAAMAGASTESS